jgi:putative phosphoesterase
MGNGLKKGASNGAEQVGGRRRPADPSKIVILSDIHGNYEAVAALPEDYDELWVLGDLVNYGPQPAEVIAWVRARAALVVRGNHDDAVAFDRDPRCSSAFRQAAEETQRYTASVLSEKDKEYLADLPYYRWVRRGRWTFYLCHAAPSDPLHTYCAPNSRTWKKELAVAGTDFLLVGHTHLQFSLREREQMVVNPGSIGQPKMGNPHATYAVWENGAVTLHSYKYPVQKTVERLGNLPIAPASRKMLMDLLETGIAPKPNNERVHV